MLADKCQPVRPNNSVKSGIRLAAGLDQQQRSIRRQINSTTSYLFNQKHATSYLFIRHSMFIQIEVNRFVAVEHFL